MRKRLPAKEQPNLKILKVAELVKVKELKMSVIKSKVKIRLLNYINVTCINHSPISIINVSHLIAFSFIHLFNSELVAFFIDKFV